MPAITYNSFFATDLQRRSGNLHEMENGSANACDRSSRHNEQIGIYYSKKHSKPNMRDTVVVLGTGDLGRALTLCLLRAGYRVVVASRTPEKHRARIESMGAEIEPYEVGIYQSILIIVAIPFEAFTSLSPEHLNGKIVIDVSNRSLDYDPKGTSLAMKLQKQLPDSKVVKGFNTLSAYALQRGLTQGSKEVPVCSDFNDAKAAVMTLVRRLGFTPIDYGNLSNAKAIEDIPLRFFAEWKFPIIFASTIWILSFLLLLFRRQLCHNFERIKDGEDWDWGAFVSLPLQNLHFSFAMTAITLLASCYFPGVLAAYIQLYRQTKYSEFPKWLDIWLQRRKQLGLMVVLLVIPHFILALVTFIGYGGLWEVWNESMYFACGMISFVLLIILGVTSLPSVAASLTWREFSFVQRYLGWSSLFLAVWHVLFMTWKNLFSNNFQCIFLPTTGQAIIIFPLLTILLKIPLLLPCIDSRLQKIRRGYEGKKSSDLKRLSDLPNFNSI